MDAASILAWIQANPGLAGVAMFLIAFGESLVLAGLVIPGAALMVGIGSLVAAGAIALEHALLATFLGAVAGDQLSFWLGRILEHRAYEHWPFNRHPQLIDRGQRFFRRYGTLSVVVGRFFGPLRPVIPFVAGLMEMSVRRFTWVNLLSALFWAPAYLLPGYLLGEAVQEVWSRWGRPAVWGLAGLLLVAYLVWRWWNSRQEKAGKD